ncbi:MAG: hypothetical protein GEV10_06585 [Streptosporangiales bacterium]|nr:hypothetical protein [Streptosporangiales bacterium]
MTYSTHQQNPWQQGVVAPGRPAPPWLRPQGGPWGQPPPPAFPAAGAYGGHQEVRRPGTILAATIMAYVGAGPLMLFGAVILIGSLNESFVEGFAGAAGLGASPLADQRMLLLGMGGGSLLLGLAVTVLALFAQQGRQWAHITLTVVGGLYTVVSLASVGNGSPQSILGATYVGVAVMLLWIGGAGARYRSRRARR